MTRFLGTWFPSLFHRHTTIDPLTPLPDGFVTAMNLDNMIAAQWFFNGGEVSLDGILKLGKDYVAAAPTDYYTIPVAVLDTDVVYPVTPTHQEVRDDVASNSDRRLKYVLTGTASLGDLEYEIDAETASDNAVIYTLHDLTVKVGIGCSGIDGLGEPVAGLYTLGEIRQYEAGLFVIDMAVEVTVSYTETSGIKGDPLDPGYPFPPIDVGPFSFGVMYRNPTSAPTEIEVGTLTFANSPGSGFDTGWVLSVPLYSDTSFPFHVVSSTNVRLDANNFVTV